MTEKETGMREYIIREHEAGQTLLKFLRKYMPLAPDSFFYKMLRKKNITYNSRKAEGKERLCEGDSIRFFLAEETIEGFRKEHTDKLAEYRTAYRTLRNIGIVYENAHLAVCNKPAGILTQKADDTEVSLNEWLVGYLLHTGAVTEAELATFRPSVLNRLDRNTYGLVLGSKSIVGSRVISEWIRDRRIRKFYRMIVLGTGLTETTLRGYLKKDSSANRVSLCNDPEAGEYIETKYAPIYEKNGKTLVEAELITGKTHQIRIHMASTGHPLIGDYKYGNREYNEYYKKKLQISSQLLAACRLEFPQTQGELSELSGKCISIPEPELFMTALLEPEIKRG